MDVLAACLSTRVRGIVSGSRILSHFFSVSEEYVCSRAAFRTNLTVCESWIECFQDASEASSGSSTPWMESFPLAYPVLEKPRV